jgi:hypothetical protein
MAFSSKTKSTKAKSSPVDQNSITCPSSHKVLDSLVAIAMTLPGITAAHAQDANITNPQTDLFYSTYSENNNRIKVESYAGSVKFPLSSHSQLELFADRDVVTGASTVGYFPRIISRASNPGVIPKTSISPKFLLTEIKTGASIADTRNDIQAKGSYFFPESKLGLMAGYSTENDFQSGYANIGSEWYFNKKNTVLFSGLGIAFNTVTPSDLSFGGPNLHNSGKYNTEKMLLGIKQDLTRDFFVQQNAELILDNGFLSDPYKRIAFNGPNTVNWPGASRRSDNIFIGYDRRPSHRITGAFATQFVYYVPYFDSSLHFDYRYILNSWNLRSNTFELAYYQPLFITWEVAPRVRYYSQNRAKFYALSFHTTPTPLFLFSKPLHEGGVASSDYRLANFGSIGFDVTITKKFREPSMKLSLSFGFTKSATTYSMSKNKGPTNPTNQFHSKYIALQLNSDLPSKATHPKKETSKETFFTYKEGNISIVPLTLAFSGLTWGRKKEDTKFASSTFSPPTMSIDMLSPRKAFGLNDTHRNGLGYDFQIGYFLRDTFEVFTDLGVITEKEFSEPIGAMNNAFRFKKRTSYRTNLGARYYFNVESVFYPFLGAMVGNERQPKTSADVYVYNRPGVGAKIGRFEIFKAQNLFNGALLVGTDYRFDETYAVSFSTGIYYYQRNKSKRLILPDETYKISDHKNKIIIPFNISLKIIF